MRATPLEMSKGHQTGRTDIGQQPLVSIITPSYNQGAFIEQTILSIKNQTYAEIEHIICDACSSDGTLGVIREHDGTYNLRWISEPDNGQADAINKGFDMARGEIVTWINSDDIYVTPEAVMKVVRCFRAYPTADVVTGEAMYIDDKGRWLQPLVQSKGRVCYEHMRYMSRMAQPATFFRRHVIQDCRCDPTLDYAFDWDLFIRIARKYNILCISELLAGFRVHPASKTSASTTPCVAEKREVIRRYLGVRTAQYLLFTCYYLLFRTADLLPRPLRIMIQRATSRASRMITTITLGRVASA